MTWPRRCRWASRRRRTSRVELRADEAEGQRRAEAALPARVPQPHRRHDRLPPAAARTRSSQIVDIMIARIEGQLKNKDMGLELTDNAKKYLAKKGFDPVLGARPLRRTIQREIEDTLSEQILFNELQPRPDRGRRLRGRPGGHREVEAGLHGRRPRRGGARRGAGRPRRCRRQPRSNSTQGNGPSATQTRPGRRRPPRPGRSTLLPGRPARHDRHRSGTGAVAA